MLSPKTLVRVIAGIISLLLSPSAHANPLATLRALLGVQVAPVTCNLLSQTWTPGYSANLVGYWRLDGTVGSITNGSSIPATVGSAGTVSNVGGNFSYASGVTAKLNQGISGSGANGTDNLNFGTPTALNDLGPATWMFWIYPTTVATGQDIPVLYKSDANGSAGWNIWLQYCDPVTCMGGTPNPGYKVSFKAVYPTDPELQTNAQYMQSGAWYQVVVTWDGTLAGCTTTPTPSCTGIHIYLNGVEPPYWWAATGATGTRTSDAAYPLWGGYDGGGFGLTSPAFNGTIDEVAIWNRVLTPTEVWLLYQKQKCN